jgi:hypothetical protein
VATLRQLRRVQSNYGQQVADLWGVDYAPPVLRVERGFTARTGDYAQGGSNGIVVDRSYLRSLSKTALRSLYVHEATHALGVGADTYSNPGGHRRYENLADASTALLAPRSADIPGWEPRAAVTRLIERQGLSPVATAPNRPKSGRNPNRNRTAGTDQRSGNNGNLPSTPAAPPLPPGQAAAYNAQFVANEQTRINAYAAIRMQGGQIRADARNALADSRYQRVQEAVGAENDALARGVIGSSGDLGARASVAAAAAGRAVDIRSAKLNGLASLRIQGMQADTDYLASNAGVLADQAAAQAELANNRYQNDLIATQTANFKALMNKYYRMLVARGKNPGGVDPRASTDPSNGLPMPYGGQYSGKVERDPYYRNPIAGTPWATGGGLG